MIDKLQALQPCLIGSIRSLPSLCQAPFRKSTSFVCLRSFTPRSRRSHSTVQAASLETQQEHSNMSEDFAGLGLGPEILTFFAELRLKTPTEIQCAAIPEIMRGGDVLLASHTGSGKTLAYLLPVVRLLRQQEKDGGVSARPKRPRALVLGPTRELTDQILHVAKTLSHHARFRSACVNGGGSMAQQAASLANPLDVLVGTPQKVVQHAKKGHLFYGDVQVVVLDEADTMFDKGFGPEVKAVLKPLRSKKEPASCVLVLATLKKDVQKFLTEEFPGIRIVKTSSLHKGVSTARHTFLPIPAQENKFDHLAQVISGDRAKRRRVMVFCNTLDSCRATEHFLKDRGFTTCCYHGDIPLDGRKEAIRMFAPSASNANEEQPVLVCTDLAARGLDIANGVDHVVNSDFPLNSIDYIHRAGRTARAGAPGKVTSLVTKRDKVLAARIEDALRNGRTLDELSAKREVLPPNMRPSGETIKRKQLEKKAERNSQKGRRGAIRTGSLPKKQPTMGGGRLKLADSPSTAKANKSYLKSSPESSSKNVSRSRGYGGASKSGYKGQNKNFEGLEGPARMRKFKSRFKSYK